MESKSVLLHQHPLWSFWWRKHTTLSYVGLTLTLSQLLAYALAGMSGIRGYNGWRWIFIIEGILTVVAAAFSKFLIVDWPETSKFLTENERKMLLSRLERDVAEARMDRLDKQAARRVFSDWKIYIG